MLRNVPLGVKLALALALTTLVALGTGALLVYHSTAGNFQDYVSMGARAHLEDSASELETLYRLEGGWPDAEAIADVLRSTGAGAMGRGMAGQGINEPLLVDERGRVLCDPTGATAVGHRLALSNLKRGLALTVDGHVVGYLLVNLGPREQVFSQRFGRSILWAGALSSVVALLLGVVLTRAIVGPVRTVRDAAQRIGAGDLAHRVPVTSNDEVGALARQFNEMAAALERDEHVRRSMMADIAHELRTPLAIVRAQVEALQDGVFELNLDNMAPIYNQTLLLSRLVDDLRDLALAEAHRLPLERSETSLGALLARIVAGFQSQAQDKDIQLKLEVPQDLPTICADAQRIEQVVDNLLSNALRHTPQGGAVRVRAWAEKPWVVFAVQDTGTGIAEEDLPLVFERFYRADRARSRSEGGTGLGLAIVKQLVTAHGGEIQVESSPGQGATFIVRLPQSDAH